METNLSEIVVTWAFHNGYRYDGTWLSLTPKGDIVWKCPDRVGGGWCTNVWIEETCRKQMIKL